MSKADLNFSEKKTKFQRSEINMAPKVPAAKKGEKRAGKTKSAGALSRWFGQEKEKGKEKGELCDLHLQGP